MTAGSMKTLDKREPDNDQGAFEGAYKMPTERSPAGEPPPQHSDLSCAAMPHTAVPPNVAVLTRACVERTGSEQDFAGTILFMASQAGAYLNGETLVSDGGRLAQLPSVY